MPQIIQEGNVTYEIPTQEELDVRAAAQAIVDADNAKVAHKKAIQEQLDALDIKSIRAIRTNDTVRMASLESQAVVLRQQLASL